MTDQAQARGDAIARIAEIFERRGAESYLGEAVTMSEHMLQAAALALAEGAPDTLVAAALLHDIGYFTSEFGGYSPADTIDNRHDAAGAKALAGAFPPAVTECVRLHVAAKRYLCATDQAYHGKLSAVSKRSLALQGGPMSAAEAADFRRQRYYREAVRVRVWDDRGKVAGLRTPSFADFRPLLQRVVDQRR
ncbi:MAG: HD domain-containing protein [Caulobacterales bacterium]